MRSIVYRRITQTHLPGFVYLKIAVIFFDRLPAAARTRAEVQFAKSYLDKANALYPTSAYVQHKLGLFELTIVSLIETRHEKTRFESVM